MSFNSIQIAIISILAGLSGSITGIDYINLKKAIKYAKVSDNIECYVITISDKEDGQIISFLPKDNVIDMGKNIIVNRNNMCSARDVKLDKDGRIIDVIYGR